jgi:uncharacterized protein (DUF362 family)
MPSSMNAYTAEGKGFLSRVRAKGPLEADIRRAIDLIGVLHRIIRGGERVLVKLNLLSDLPPPAASDPLLLVALSRLPKAAGANEVVVADASFWTVDTSRGMASLELRELEAGIDFRPLGHRGWELVRTGGRWWPRATMPRVFFEADRIILVPSLKTHHSTDFSISLKLSMGFMRPRKRPLVHLLDFWVP